MKVITDDCHYCDIADAIREKHGNARRYCPDEMAEAILEIRGGSIYPVLELPSEYEDHVAYARENLYDGEYSHLMVLEYGDWFAVSFLMSDFTIETFDDVTTEFTATGWFTCGYTKSTGEWTAHDYTSEASTGGNYAKHIRFASRYITYNGQTLFPVGMGARVETEMYSYNGVVLPKLPTVDRNKYPFWLVYYSPNYSGYYLVATDKHLHTTYEAGNKYFFTSNYQITDIFIGVKAKLPDGESEWVVETIDGEISEFSAMSQLIWSNWDIPDPVTDGIYLAASEPVPVYE